MRSIQLYSLVDRRQRRQSARSRSTRRRVEHFSLGLAAVLVLLLAVGLLLTGFWFAGIVNDLPSLAALPEFFNPNGGLMFQPTRIYDRSGQHLLYTLENPGIPRRYLKVDPAEADHFSPELVRATIAMVDPTFWSNPGFSWERLADPQPATLTEHLVLDLVLEQEPSDLRRALRMRILAAQMVSQYGRTRVLEWYLNSVSYGHMAYGAESAARLYLDKSAAEVNLAEAVLLASLAGSPALNPIDSPAAATERQQTALELLLEDGAISKDEEVKAAQTHLTFRSASTENQAVSGAFNALVLEQLSARLGRQRLERGGLRITTSLDYDLQLELDCMVRTQLGRLEGHDGDFSLPDGSACQAARLLPTLPPGENLSASLAASGVILDPQTGQVLALSGDISLGSTSAFIPAHAPGSMLTPFAAVAAFARSYSPASLVWDIPNALPADLKTFDQRTEYHGPVRLRLAIANDYLGPQAQILEQVGPENVWQLTTNLGLTTLAGEKGASALFEGSKVSLVDLAQAYSVFPNLGSLFGWRQSSSAGLQAVSSLYVEDLNGRVLLDDTHAASQPVLSEPLAYLMHSILSDEQARWPSMGYPNPLEIGRPAGAKVGSVNAGSEVWAVGYTQQRLALFWLGLPAQDATAGAVKPEVHQVAGLWHAMIQYANRDLPVQDWQVPAGVSSVAVCDPSGQLPTGACPTVVNEVFLNGNEPVSYDALYKVIQVNRETGRLATVFTPPGLVDEHVFMVVPPEARDWAAKAGIELAPEVYDAIQPPAPSADVQLTSPDLFAVVRGKVNLQGTAAGDGFSLYRLQAGAGLNPQTWQQIGADGPSPVKAGALGVWDTQGLNGLYALRLLVVRTDQSIETATLQVTVDNTPPLARLLYPLPGQQFHRSSDAQVTFQAEASDAVGLKQVVWVLDGQVIGQNLVAPYSFTWQPTEGKHSLLVRAFDLAGNPGESTAIEFTVLK